ncbi:MAG: dTDP-4-amino-4,6-dideoxygalactose transaminase [Pseudomonadota bacterium]
MTDYRIPFNRPFFIGNELKYIEAAVRGGVTAGDGPFTRQCQALMEQRFGARKILLTHSCTAALEMSALLADIRPGDEVVLPSYTFVSTANAFHLRGARLRFIDIRGDNLNMDEELLPDLLTAQTRAIVPVHYAGAGCNMDVIMDVAANHKLVVIEDAAQAVDATYGDRYLGTIGHMGTYSFHETKNVISGEGGALVINDEQFIHRAEIIREKGTNRSSFFRGEVDKYTWVDVGSSYLPSDMIAAFLLAQLEQIDVITRRRREIFSYYASTLAELEDAGLLVLSRDHAGSNGHMFFVLARSNDERQGLINFLKGRGILSVFHYVPLHLSPIGQQMGYRQGDLPVTEALSDRLLRLPFYFEMTRDEQDQVVAGITDYFS